MTHASTVQITQPGFSLALWRVLILVLMITGAVTGIWPLTVPPDAGMAAGPADFSVDRALQDLRVITTSPRVPGAVEYDAARDYLRAEFEKLGLEVEVTDVEFVNQHPEQNAFTAARSHNLVARLKGTASTGAVLVAGHLDSAPTALGASDCGGCAVGVLETARALSAGEPLQNDVIFLIEDGEETTRSGSISFSLQHPWARDVRAAINMEGMGTNGASTLYVTGPRNGWVMTEALKAMPKPVAYSFINDLVWLTGTGGSDLDEFLQVSPVGVGLVYTGNVPAYHTMKDSVENLDPRTLQHQGDNALGMARHFANAALDGKLQAPDLVYFNLAGHVVVRYPGWVGIVLALLAFAGFVTVLTTGLRRGNFGLGRVLAGFGVFLPLVFGSAALCGLIWFGVRFVDPRLQVYMVGITYDREWYTLAFALLASGLMALGCGLFRRASFAELGAGALAWFVIFGLLTAIWRPGVSPFFTIPALLALIPLGLWVSAQRTGMRPLHFLLTGAAAFGIVLITAPVISFLGVFSGRGELLMSLPVIALLPALFTAPVAGLLLPVLDLFKGRGRWNIALALTGAAGLILLSIALTASFTPDRPKPNMVAYVQDKDQSYWTTVGVDVGGSRAGLLDEWTGQFLGDNPEESTFSASGAFASVMSTPAYRAAAPRADLADMDVTVLSDETSADGLRHLKLNSRFAARRAYFRHPAEE